MSFPNLLSPHRQAGHDIDLSMFKISNNNKKDKRQKKKKKKRKSLESESQKNDEI